MSVNCTHCNCNVNGKPWIIYGNTNYCSYMCAKNKPMYYRWEDIKIKEDFNYNLIPVIKKKKCIRAFSILMDSEISELSEEEYNDYIYQLDEFKFHYPERYYEMCDIMNEYIDYDEFEIDELEGYYSDEYDTENSYL